MVFLELRFSTVLRAATMSIVSNSPVVPNPIAVTIATSQDSAPAPRTGVGRVLHVVNGEHFSGAERVQQLLGKRLSQFGFDPLFACVKPGKFRACCDLRDYQLIDAPMRGRVDLQVVRQLTKLVGSHSIDLLHAHTPRTALVTSLVARRTDKPWIYHVHSPTTRDSTRGVINRVNAFVERFAIRNCNLLLTVSKSLRREMLRRGVDRSRLAVVANGVPEIDPIDTQARLTSRRWRIGMIALMRPRKGVEVALEAMQRIKEKELPVELVLIGGFETDSYQCQMLERIEAAGLQDRVQWKGFTRDIPAALQRLDALLLPSLFGEGMPMVVLEALSAAVPVIATRVEGTPEVIRDGVEGYLATPGCPASLAEKIEQLISSRTNWQHLSQQALQRHRSEFCDTHMAEKTARAYRRLLPA